MAKRVQSCNLELYYTTGGNIGEATEEMRTMLRETKSEPCLSDLCRDLIRKHLLKLDPHENLFIRVPRLGLPAALSDYILFNVSLDDGDNEDDNNDCSSSEQKSLCVQK